MLGPVFSSELVRTSRRSHYYVARACYGLMILVAFGFCHYLSFRIEPQWSLAQSATFNLSFFYLFTILQLIVACLVTCAVTAGTVAEERERRTLDYMFASDLRSWELVLGKLAVRVLHVLAILAAPVPILFMTMFFGGVDGNVLVSSCLLSLSCALTTACVCLLISVLSKRARDAYLRSIVFLGLGIFGTFYLSYFSGFLPPPVLYFTEPVLHQIYYMNPLIYLVQELGVSIQVQLGLDGLYNLIVRQAILCVLCLVIAIWKVRGIHLTAVAKPRTDTRFPRFFSWKPGVGRFPMVWKEMFGEKTFRHLSRTARTLVLILTVLFLAPIGLLYFRTLSGSVLISLFHQIASLLSTVLCMGFLVLVAARSAASISTEKELGNWDLLMSTDLTATQIIIGKILGNLFAFRSIFGLLVLLWLVVASFEASYFLDGVNVMVATAIIGIFYAGTGVLLSLVSSTTSRAMWATLGITLIVMGGYLLMFDAYSTKRPPDYGYLLSVYHVLMSIATSEYGYNTWRISLWTAQQGVLIYLVMGIAVQVLTILLFDLFSGRSRRQGRIRGFLQSLAKRGPWSPSPARIAVETLAADASG